MSEFESLHVSAPLAAALEGMGVTPADPAVREATPTAARGHNLVLVAPPAACHASPVLAGMLSHFQAGTSRMLLLSPDAALEEWCAALAPLARAAGYSLEMAHQPARATRRLRTGALDILLCTPDTALTLLRRSALKMESVTHLALCWPELWEDQEPLAPLMQDLPKESQRVVFTSRPETTADLTERYARRALVAGGGAHPALEGTARIVTTPWTDRARAAISVLEMLDPASATIWVAHQSEVRSLQERLPPGDRGVQVATGDAPDADLVIAYDLPTPERIPQLLKAGPLVFLVPASAAEYLRTRVSECRPLRLPGILEAVERASATRRATIARTLDEAGLEAELITLAPLFERHEPAAVAAALYRLWAQGTATVPSAPSEEIPATARLWVGIGKKDGATPHDLMATLTREIRLDRKAIGRIDVRELYCLVEVPARDVERVAALMNGVTIRKRRVTARVDRGGRSDKKTTGDAERSEGRREIRSKR